MALVLQDAFVMNLKRLKTTAALLILFIFLTGVRSFGYLIDIDNFPAPPAAGSQQDIDDLNEVKRWQKVRTAEQCEQAKAEAYLEFKFTFIQPYGPIPQKDESVLENFYGKIFNKTDFYVLKLKQKWNRQRPFVRDPSIIRCVPAHPSSSYPSGHSTIGYVEAKIFGEIYPELKAALLIRGLEIGQNRVISGVHHPSDIEAGRQLGELVYKELMETPEIKSDIESIKNNLKDMVIKNL